VLVTHIKKPIRVVLNELDKEDAACFACEYFARVRLGPLNISSLNCTHRLLRMLELMAAVSSTKMRGYTDVDLDHLPPKRRRIESTNASSRPLSTASQHFGGTGGRYHYNDI
jgi:hypothetical protein